MMLPVAHCATTTEYVDRIVEVRPAIPPGILDCKPEPEPLAATARQRHQAPYMLDLAAAGRDCRRNLGTVKRLLAEPKT